MKKKDGKGMKQQETEHREGISAYRLKVIAVSGMTANHIACAFADSLPFWLLCILTAVGGITFPIMAFLLTEGFHYTRSRKKYLLRLITIGLLAQFPYVAALQMMQMNIMFTLAWGLILIWIADQIRLQVLRILLLCLFMILTVGYDWGIAGVLIIYLFERMREYGRWRILLGVLVMPVLVGGTELMHYLNGAKEVLPDLLMIWFGSFAAYVLLCRYRGYRGGRKKGQYWFYFYYPFHLVLLAILRII